MEEKNELDALREKLLYKQKQGYDIIDVDERIKLEEYATAYKAYLNAARTEREAVTEAIAQAEALGFVPYERGMVLEPGAKIYKSVRGKALMLAVMGRERSIMARTSPRRTSIPRALTSSPSPSTKRTRSAFSRRITTAASRNTSGSPSRWKSTAS